MPKDEFDARCLYCDTGISFPDPNAVWLDVSRNVEHESTSIKTVDMTFCSERHLVAQFSEHGLSSDDWALDITREGFQYGGTIVAVMAVALALYGTVRLVMDLL